MPSTVSELLGVDIEGIRMGAALLNGYEHGELSRRLTKVADDLTDALTGIWLAAYEKGKQDA